MLTQGIKTAAMNFKLRVKKIFDYDLHNVKSEFSKRNLALERATLHPSTKLRANGQNYVDQTNVYQCPFEYVQCFKNNRMSKIAAE